MDPQVIQAQKNRLVRDRAELKLKLVDAQVAQQANGGDLQIQTRADSLSAQIKGIEARLDELGVTPEGISNLEAFILGSAVSTVTPENSPPAPTAKGLPTGGPTSTTPNEGSNMTQPNNTEKRTRGVPIWAVAIGGLLVFVLLLLVFVVLDDMNKTGSSNPADNALVASPTASPTSAQSQEPASVAPSDQASAAPSNDQTFGLPLGTESEGCLDGVRYGSGGIGDHDPKANPGDWTVPCDGMYRAVNYWNPSTTEYNRGSGQTNALFVCYDQHVVLKNGGGSMYQWTHAGTADGNFRDSVNDNNPVVKLSDLVAQGLATVSVDGGGKSLCDDPNWLVSGNGEKPTATQSPTASSGSNPPALQDGCTTTNKQGTFSEFYGLGKDGYTPINQVQRIEVAGFSGWSEMDYYTLVPDKSVNGAHRVPTINYVFPPREELNGLVPIWFGNGSPWNYGTDNSQCNKDYALEWAKFYASQGSIEPGRLDNGNSGVVVDMSSCTLYNTRSELGWDHKNIQQLLDAHRASMIATPCTQLVDSQDSTVSYDLTPQAHDARNTDDNLPSGPDASSSDQCAVVDSDNTGGLLSHWTIKTTADQIAVVNYWNNKKYPNPFYKFMLKPSDSITLVGGGDVSFFPAACENSDVVQDGLHTLDKSKGQKLVDVEDIPSKYKK